MAVAFFAPAASAQFTIGTVAGGGPPNGIPATAMGISFTSSSATDAAGNLYISASQLNRVFKVDGTGAVTTVAGNGGGGFSGDGGPGANAQVSTPGAVALDSAGNLYIADTGNERIRKVSAAGVITTVAGNGVCTFSGDNGPATSAALCNPEGVAVDGAGNLYIADSSNERIRKVSTGGVITTVAGNGTPGYSGDNGPATSAELNFPQSVAVDSAGNLYIADQGSQRIRKVSGGNITTVAGGGPPNGAAATSIAVSAQGVALDGAGNVYTFLRPLGIAFSKSAPPGPSRRWPETAFSASPAMADRPPAPNSVIQKG